MLIVKRGRQRKDLQLGMYEYLCQKFERISNFSYSSYQDHLTSLREENPEFAAILFNKIESQIEKYQGRWFGIKVHSYQTRLMSYFETEYMIDFKNVT